MGKINTPPPNALSKILNPLELKKSRVYFRFGLILRSCILLFSIFTFNNFTFGQRSNIDKFTTWTSAIADISNKIYNELICNKEFCQLKEKIFVPPIIITDVSDTNPVIKNMRHVLILNLNKTIEIQNKKQVESLKLPENLFTEEKNNNSSRIRFEIKGAILNSLLSFTQANIIDCQNNFKVLISLNSCLHFQSCIDIYNQLFETKDQLNSYFSRYQNDEFFIYKLEEFIDKGNFQNNLKILSLHEINKQFISEGIHIDTNIIRETIDLVFEPPNHSSCETPYYCKIGDYAGNLNRVIAYIALSKNAFWQEYLRYNYCYKMPQTPNNANDYLYKLDSLNDLNTKILQPIYNRYYRFQQVEIAHSIGLHKRSNWQDNLNKDGASYKEYTQSKILDYLYDCNVKKADKIFVISEGHDITKKILKGINYYSLGGENDDYILDVKQTKSENKEKIRIYAELSKKNKTIFTNEIELNVKKRTIEKILPFGIGTWIMDNLGIGPKFSEESETTKDSTGKVISVNGQKVISDTTKFKTDSLSNNDTILSKKDIEKLKNDTAKLKGDNKKLKSDNDKLRQGIQPPLMIHAVLNFNNFDSIPLYFALDSFKLENYHLEILDKISKNVTSWVKDSIYIKGFTDYLGPEGYNMDLSYKRAKSVWDYLYQKHAVARIITVGRLEAKEKMHQNNLDRKVMIYYKLYKKR